MEMSVTSNQEGDYIKWWHRGKNRDKILQFFLGYETAEDVQSAALQCCVRQYKRSWKFMTICAACQAYETTVEWFHENISGKSTKHFEPMMHMPSSNCSWVYSAM